MGGVRCAIGLEYNQLGDGSLVALSQERKGLAQSYVLNFCSVKGLELQTTGWLADSYKELFPRLNIFSYTYRYALIQKMTCDTCTVLL